eukprot:280829-Chlamydomonas_euryale.AAC.2
MGRSLDSQPQQGFLSGARHSSPAAISNHAFKHSSWPQGLSVQLFPAGLLAARLVSTLIACSASLGQLP